MEKAIEAFQKELNRLRTGRASPALLEGIRVDYYGTPTPINQTASINIPESRLIVIQPWDKSTIESIEKAIQKANLGLSPTNDGTVIRLNIPALTQERRQELQKLVGKRVEEVFDMVILSVGDAIVSQQRQEGSRNVVGV